MSVEVPKDMAELRAGIARDSLTHHFMQAFSEEPPDYILNDPQKIKEAYREWRQNYNQEVMLLSIAARSALLYFGTGGREAAITAFTSSVLTQPELDAFMHANLYLQQLVAATLRNSDSFRALLELFVRLEEAAH